MENINLCPPWETYRRELAAFFELDEQVSVSEVTETEDGKSVTLTVTDAGKAAALEKVLKKSVTFGNVSLNIGIIDASGVDSLADTLKKAFAFNELVRRVAVGHDHTGTEHVFVICVPDIIQFFNDDLSDYAGNFNGLVADVARDLFDAPAHFNTQDVEKN